MLPIHVLGPFLSEGPESVLSLYSRVVPTVTINPHLILQPTTLQALLQKAFHLAKRLTVAFHQTHNSEVSHNEIGKYRVDA